MKQCPKCRAEGIGPKPLSEFCKGSGKDGLQHACRMHTREYSRKWAKANPEKNREKGRRFRVASPKAYRKISVRTGLRQRYGLSEADFQKLFDLQNGKCAICALPLVSQLDYDRPAKGHAPNEYARVDHDHVTGKVRGLLCFSCNVGLGKFRDDEKVLLQAVRYLRESATVQRGSRAQPEMLQGESGPVYQERDPNQAKDRGNRREELTPFHLEELSNVN